MARSTAFPRIRAEVIRLVGLIPPGRFTTYGSIATHMNCNPRHVAFVLARLDEREAAELPWHRVVAADARISRSMDPGLAARQNIVSARPAPRLLPIPDPPDGRTHHQKTLAQSTIRGPRSQEVERRYRSLSCYEYGLSAKQQSPPKIFEFLVPVLFTMLAGGSTYLLKAAIGKPKDG